MWVHYFFTEMGANLTDFLENTEIEIWITCGEWTKPLCKGVVKPLTHFKIVPGSQDQKLQNYHVYFYGPRIDKFYLNMTAGLKMDQEIKNEELKLMKYGNVLFPENSYYNCDEIPVEWLELFTDRSTFLNTAAVEESEQLKMLGVTPFSTKKELDYNFLQWNIHEHKKHEV